MGLGARRGCSALGLSSVAAGCSPRSSPSRSGSLEGREKTSGPSRATGPLQAMCTACWARKVNGHCPVRHQALKSKSKEKPKAIPSPEELLQGRMADKRFTLLQGYCRLLSQQGVVQATPVVTEEAQPRVNALRRGGGASSTSIAAVTATGKWSSQDTSLVTCQEHR